MKPRETPMAAEPPNSTLPAAGARSAQNAAALAAQYRDRARDLLRKMQAEPLPRVRQAYGRAASRFLQLAEAAGASARRRYTEAAVVEDRRTR